jgi:hypothetical protein
MLATSSGPAHEDTWAEAGGRFYHLGRGPGVEEQDCLDFEALTYDRYRQDWFWSLLPSPPFERYMIVTIESFADAGTALAIRISTRDDTYAFDAARAWRKQGDWALPFRGRAQYVADYGLWFGFTDSQASGLCAADLNVAGTSGPTSTAAHTTAASGWSTPTSRTWAAAGSV